LPGRLCALTWGFGLDAGPPPGVADGLVRQIWGSDTVSVPIQVTGITSPIASVISGQNTIVARGTDGSLWSWGDSGFGANGSGGSGANPGRVPRVPAAQAVFDLEGGTWFAAV